MSKKIQVLGITLAVAACFLGSAVGTWLIPEHAQAQSTTLRAYRYELLDKSGNVRISMDMTPDNEPNIFLWDTNGKIRANFTLFRDGSGGIAFNDASGQVTNVLP